MAKCSSLQYPRMKMHQRLGAVSDFRSSVPYTAIARWSVQSSMGRRVLVRSHCDRGSGGLYC
ncbi:hypothetical protein Plhal304r1_c033g0105391 [Plasmopara halstedii]